MSAGVRGWLGERLDEVPPELLRRLDLAPAEGRETVRETLTRRGLEALSEAAGRPGRDREAAFRLLAADAYLTYACEATVEEADVETALVDLIRLVAHEAG